MLSARNVDQGRIIFDDFRYISDESFEMEHARTRISPGDVLLTIVGTIGRSAVVPECLEPFALQRSVAVLSPKEDLLPKFLAYQLQSPRIQRHFKEHARGTAQKGVYLKTLGETPLFVPSVSEQRAIVAEIEKQFSRLDEAVTNLKRVRANLKRYKAAVLKAAVEGRLVPTEAELAQRERRTYETGTELLSRVLEARAGKRVVKGKQKASSAPKLRGLPALPDGWCWSTFEAVADRVTVGHVGPMKNEYVTDGIPFLRSQNVRPNRLDPEGLKYISPAFHSRLEKSSLGPGDIVVVRSGSVGVSCVIPAALRVANCSDLVIVKSPRAVLPAFGAYYLNAVVASRIAAGRVGVALVHFNTQSVAELPVPVPPLSEQRRIVSEVDRYLSLAESMEAYANNALARAAVIRNAYLSKSFSRS
jgi:type I restriction enzyme S subunit